MPRLSSEHAQFSLSLETTCFVVYSQLNKCQNALPEQSNHFISAAWKKYNVRRIPAC